MRVAAICIPCCRNLCRLACGATCLVALRLPTPPFNINIIIIITAAIILGQELHGNIPAAAGGACES